MIEPLRGCDHSSARGSTATTYSSPVPGRAADKYEVAAGCVRGMRAVPCPARCHLAVPCMCMACGACGLHAVVWFGAVRLTSSHS